MEIVRRRISLGVAAAAGLLAAGLKPGSSAAAWNRKAFDARKLDDALRAAGMAGAAPSSAIAISAPDVPENPAFVSVQIESRVPGTQSIGVFVDRNPFPYIVRFELTPAVVPALSLRLRVGETSPVRVVVGAGGKHHFAVREVRVVGGGCTDPAFTGDPSGAPAKSGPTRMRAAMRGGVAEVRALLAHPMENGLRKDAAGKPIVEHFIQALDLRLNGRSVLTAEVGRSVSTNPLFAFKLQGAKAGDQVALDWRDNKGQARSDETVIGA